MEDLLINDSLLPGLSILSVSGELKKAYAEVIKARKEVQASLEKARGETATLRSLANAAKMIESNPELARLSLIQTIAASKATGL